MNPTTPASAPLAAPLAEAPAATFDGPRRGRSAHRATGLLLAAACALTLSATLSACGDSDDDTDAASPDAASPEAASPDAAGPDGSDGGTGSDGATPGGQRATKDLSTLLWMGDSIAASEAPALGAAMEASGVAFTSMAAVGGGGVVGEISASTWETLPGQLESAAPDVVAYQITTYDWGTPDEQRAAYQRLARTVTDAGAELVIVSAPPFRLDDFYQPHEAEIEAAPRSAERVATELPSDVLFLDAAELWGTDSAAEKAQRSEDGIHSCQQGSAAFAQWFGTELSERYAFTAASAEEWATGSWTGDEVYGSLGCA